MIVASSLLSFADMPVFIPRVRAFYVLMFADLIRFRFKALSLV